MLRIAVPNKGKLADSAAEMLREAGYRQRREQRDLIVLDPTNEIEFFYLRPKDIPVYVGSGELDLGVTGRDQALNSGAHVEEVLPLGFAQSTLRYAGSAGREWRLADLEGKRVATSLSRLVKDDLTRHGVNAEVIRLDGAVEISIQLGLADAIADVVETGRSLRQHNLVAFGDPLCTSEAVLVQRVDSAPSRRKTQFAARLQGVAFAQQYMMLDYDCPRDRLETAVALTPGLESPTVASLADENWVAVRSMISRREVNRVMDELAEAGARAILASDIRSCRM